MKLSLQTQLLPDVERACQLGVRQCSETPTKVSLPFFSLIGNINLCNRNLKIRKKECQHEICCQKKTRSSQIKIRLSCLTHRHQKRWIHSQCRCQATEMGAQRPIFPRQHRTSHNARSARSADNVDGGKDGASWADHFSLH